MQYRYKVVFSLLELVVAVHDVLVPLLVAVGPAVALPPGRQALEPTIQKTPTYVETSV